MKTQNEAIEVAPAVSASPPRLAMLVVLAALVGVLLVAIAVGAWLHYQQRAAWDAEVLTLREALEKKNIALADLQAQNASLGRQFKILKGYSIASSTAVSEKAAPDKNVAPAEPKPTAKGTPKAPVSSTAKKTQRADCELVGKTPEQQAQTLQRCVSLIDAAPATRRQ